MRVIHKFPLQVFGFDYGETDVPEGEILKCEFQHGIVNVWVSREVNSAGQMRLKLVPTGKTFDDNGMLHVGSAVSPTTCWHVYKVY